MVKYLVEHLEEELFEWSILEYAHMIEHVGEENLIICNLKPVDAKREIPQLKGAILTTKNAKDFEGRVALLDQCAEQEMDPSDRFDYVIVGGILGTDEFEGPLV